MMMEKSRLHFPQLVDMLFSLVGVWPVGTLVRLSDASIAVVRIENEQDIFGPVVEILYPDEKRQTLDLSRQTAGLTITASIDPASEEGKPFASRV
jgi:hypothetical protein